MDLGLEGKTVLVTGGTKGIGRAIVQAFVDEGATVAFCARNPEDVRAAESFFTAGGATVRGSVVDAGVGEVIARGIERSTDVFGLPSDIAMPCALGGAVDVREAGLMTAKYVIEGANGPLTPGADAVLNERGVIIVPDIFANAGGVTCSYLEQCQNFAHLQWDEDEVNASVVATMRAAFKRLH